MKKYTGLFLSLLALTFALCLPGCSVTDAPAFLDSIAHMVGGWMPASAFIVAAIEFVVRIIPSVNPRSLILLASEILHSIGNLAGALSAFLDSLGLQNVKQ